MNRRVICGAQCEDMWRPMRSEGGVPLPVPLTHQGEGGVDVRRGHAMNRGGVVRCGAMWAKWLFFLGLGVAACLHRALEFEF